MAGWAAALTVVFRNPAFSKICDGISLIDSTQSFQFFDRGPSPVARLVFFAALSLLLLFVDARYRYLESTRSALSVLISPIQRLATLPGALWESAGDFFITQSTQHDLIKQNEELKQQHQTDAAQLLQLQALQLENQQLRNLDGLPIRNEFTTQLVEVIYAERDVFSRKVLINKGADANVQLGQVVIDDNGIVGQITRVYPWLSEVTLITEKIMRFRCRCCAAGCAPSCSAPEIPASCRCAICRTVRMSRTTTCWSLQA